MHTAETDGVPILVCTVVRYDARCVDDLHAMLKAADEQQPAKDGTVEAWSRSPRNPIGG